MKCKITALSLTCVVLLDAVCLQSAVADRMVEREAIEEITRDIRTAEQRSSAVSRLSAIVQDPNGNMRLRELAAEELGHLRAIEAKGMLKTLAVGLEWADSTRQLKRATTLAYWKIRVVEEPNEVAQEELLMKLLWGKQHPPPHADVVWSWAADELANRGVKKALPEIVKCIRRHNPGDRGEKEIWLCSTKIELLSTSKSRQEALRKALKMKDLTQEKWLTRWAVTELGKLKTKESRTILIKYALGLQVRRYGVIARLRGRKSDRSDMYAGKFYRAVIKILKASGMTTAEIRATGLRPGKCFIAPP